MVFCEASPSASPISTVPLFLFPGSSQEQLYCRTLIRVAPNLRARTYPTGQRIFQHPHNGFRQRKVVEGASTESDSGRICQHGHEAQDHMLLRFVLTQIVLVVVQLDELTLYADFDGTIFMQDTGHILFDNFGCGAEKKAALDAQIQSGERSFRDVSDEMWGSLDVPFDDGFAVMKEALEMDPE
jgi:hypothetical protein